MKGKFVTVINCMDGRCQKPVFEYMQNNFMADYADMITEPGPNKILAEGIETNTIESVKKKVEISVLKHGSEIIAVAAHYDCAGNPENEDIQKDHLKKAVNVIESWKFPVKKIISLWLDADFKPDVVS